jgi:putative DNA primase/helicase
VLKQFTAGDRMHFDRKHISPVEEYPTARLVLSANNRPQFSDGSAGLWRRMILIPFRVVIAVERQDKQLVDKLKAELPGIFNWAIEGLRRLQRQGRFANPAICEAAVNEYGLESNPARVFLAEHVVEDAAQTIPSLTLYSSYVGWAEVHGYKPLDARQFGKEVRRSFPRAERVKVTVGSGREHAYRGLSHDPMRALHLACGALQPNSTDSE